MLSAPEPESARVHSVADCRNAAAAAAAAVAEAAEDVADTRRQSSLGVDWLSHILHPDTVAAPALLRCPDIDRSPFAASTGAARDSLRIALHHADPALSLAVDTARTGRSSLAGQSAAAAAAAAAAGHIVRVDSTTC